MPAKAWTGKGRDRLHACQSMDGERAGKGGGGGSDTQTLPSIVCVRGDAQSAEPLRNTAIWRCRVQCLPSSCSFSLTSVLHSTSLHAMRPSLGTECSGADHD